MPEGVGLEDDETEGVTEFSGMTITEGPVCTIDENIRSEGYEV